MRKFFKILLYTLLTFLIVGAISLAAFIYKVKYGFPIYESEAPTLPEFSEGFSVLLFSKTNGFRHGESIEASLPIFKQMAETHGWNLYPTDNGAVFNEQDLARFDVVVWNNVSGRVLKPEQRAVFQSYIESGGGFVGIHAAGDGSHHWDWYSNKLVGANFSHHSIDPHLQNGKLYLESDTSYKNLTKSLPQTWEHTDEWYVFFDNPRDKGKQVLYTLDETDLEMSGNMRFMVKDKDFGMGDDHPIIWYGEVGAGKGVYSALGHSAAGFSEPTHVNFLENAIIWAGTK